MKFSDFLPVGANNALSMRELAVILDTSERGVRKLVYAARLHGELVCSDDRGYYIPANALEASAYFHAQSARLKSGSAVLRPVRDYIRRECDEKQLNFNDYTGGIN